MELSYDPETEQLTITPDRRTVRMTFNRGTGRTSIWVNPMGLSQVESFTIFNIIIITIINY
ncbi:hypothetical protein TYRP_023670, partial [Tyrophagus putrescentiae]